MTVLRSLTPVVCLALTACCPTLFVQVTKSEPAPWPELPAPVTLPPAIPTTMQNRFDVLAACPGTLTRYADDYRDVIDARDDELAQSTNALTALGQIITKFHDEPFETCTPAASSVAKCGEGSSGSCDELIVDPATPVSVGQAAVIAGQLRIVEGVGEPGDWGQANGKLVKLSTRFAATNGPIAACFEDAVLSRPLLSFVHVSDIQLRDPSVTLTDRKLSKKLDWFEPLDSFEYDEDLAFYNQYLFEGVIATINSAVHAPGDPAPPSFVIHTGDSIDSNMMSELLRFHKIVDRLDIPFFELFGNHDLLVFGNLVPSETHGGTDDSACTPVGALIGAQSRWAPNKLCVDRLVKRCPTCLGKDTQFVASPAGHEETRQRFMSVLQHTNAEPVAEPTHATAGEYCSDTLPKVFSSAYSRDHGFDLGTRTGTLDGARLGYYAFVQSTTDPNRKAVFVALDSEELPDHAGGITGHIGHAQLDWLRGVLGCVKATHPHDLVFVFAHQPLSMLGVDPEDAKDNVEDVLDAAVPNVVAYLYGHHHQHSICGDGRPGKTCTQFWEIETGSLVEFPQEARMVRIKQVAKTLGFLEVSTFGEHLADSGSVNARYINLARKGAERDHCVTHDARCSDDKRPYRTDGDSTAARLFFRLPK